MGALLQEKDEKAGGLRCLAQTNMYCGKSKHDGRVQPRGTAHLLIFLEIRIKLLVCLQSGKLPEQSSCGFVQFVTFRVAFIQMKKSDKSGEIIRIVLYFLLNLFPETRGFFVGQVCRNLYIPLR